MKNHDKTPDDDDSLSGVCYCFYPIQIKEFLLLVKSVVVQGMVFCHAC